MKKKIHVYSKTSFILSLLLWLPLLNIFTSILAIVFGVISLKELRSDNTRRGQGLSIAGIAIGIVTIMLSLVGFFMFPEIYLGQNVTS